LRLPTSKRDFITMSLFKKQHYCILAIETSCDDTGIAIIKDGILIANAISTSLKQHEKFGGIVPEIAARSHAEEISKTFNNALIQARINPEDLTHIAYTAYPGLPGSLHVGKVFAKSIANLLEIPLIPIDHMLSHVFSFSINQSQKIKFPFLGFVASGGHTIIYLFKDYDKYEVLNNTTDDPVGETLDKVGRMLQLPYPGGV